MKKIPEVFLDRIREARENKFSLLDLSGFGAEDDEKLIEIPAEVFELEHLEELDLSDNLLTSIPESILQLHNLTSLKLYRNQLTNIPEYISQLRNLSIFNVSFNRLISIPDSISQLIKLERLILHNNQLAAIPAFIAKLPNLRALYLGDNQLTAVPEFLAEMKNLLELDLAGFNLAEVPGFIADMKNIHTLYLDDNNLTTIPDFIFKLPNLNFLYLDRNQIREIPGEVLQLEKLVALNIISNPIEKPPPEVVSEGIEAIKNYFRQVKTEGQDFLYEAKMLIVGEGGAGKTSLARKIKNSSYQLREDEESTEGIEVIQWHFTGQNGQRFRVNIWDFGGQEIYHATHQFFLTKRSLYALVADTRKEDTDFFYWLNVVELLSDNSPLLIVKNEKQDRQREISENQLRGQFSNLKETLAVNLSDNRGLPNILEEIKHYISNLPHIGTPLPKTWVRVRETLENDPRNHITLSEYLNICEQNGFTERKDKLQLSGYLHDLGVCLHFQDDPLLKNTVILKTGWGTSAVYKVLDNKMVVNNFGKFDRNDLEAIWHEETYTEMQDELLQLMMKFKLCYKIPGGDSYIAPQLLTGNQPHYDWDEADNLILRYTYEFMPKGIITQFIVAMHTLILDQRYVWKSGIILEMDETKAEVIEHYGKRETRIRVTGKRKKELMAIVTYELDKIHASYKRLRYNKLIPCNCATCKDSQDPHFYPHEVLRRFIDAGQKGGIQCQKSFQMVDVRKMIDDVIEPPGEEVDKRKLSSEPARDQVFISYSHRDAEWLDRLQIMLRPLTRHREISVWDDTKIKAGEKWKDEIEKALSLARVAVLLVSPDFLASDFIAQDELPSLLKAAEDDGLVILWIAVSHSLYKRTEIASYQAANDPSTPLDGLSRSEANRVLARIAEKINAEANRQPPDE